MDWITAVALATLIVGLFAWIRADMAALRKEMRGEFSLLGKEVDTLRERMARLEGLLEGSRGTVTGNPAA